ncbi:MAG TPA: GGDEF domain-containing protein [Burkholderiaceae bacterium]|nr:GGDEF domain-containing protein [Burkholderiaceae bacterium]
MFPTLPSQASIARNWHLYLYRLVLPLLVLWGMAQAWQADDSLDLFAGALTAALFLLLWGTTWLPGPQAVRMRQVDIGVSLMVWVSLGNSLLQATLFRSSASIDTLAAYLYWAPLLAVYWGMVFHDRRRFGLGQAVLYYATFLIMDAAVVRLAGRSLFLFGTFQAVAQALVVLLLVAIFSTLHAQMIENEALFQRAEHRANHDELTGLLNRRTFSQHLPTIVRRSAEKNLELSLMLIDFDHFKSINDRYGHSVGDQMLMQVATLFEMGLRLDDLLYRWGGDEFAVIMRDTDIDTAYRVAERLRQKVEKFNFGLDQAITISIGVASLRAGESHKELFRRADEAMLSGKQGGHNQVEIAVAAGVAARPAGAA